MEELKTKIKYYLRKLTERPIICFCVAIAILLLQYILLEIIPFRFISTVIALLMQFSTLALCSKAVVFAADAPTKWALPVRWAPAFCLWTKGSLWSKIRPTNSLPPPRPSVQENSFPKFYNPSVRLAFAGRTFFGWYSTFFAEFA